MPHSFGYRARTRSLFSQPFRRNGPVHLSTYLTTFRIGEYVDIKANGSIHKGMPHKFYHGKTGIVWNVSKRAIGVEVNKVVRNRIIKKRIHVRIEHARKSRCREDFLNRVKRNDQLRTEAKKAGKKVELKRAPAAPRPGHFVNLKKTTIEQITPLRYEMLV